MDIYQKIELKRKIEKTLKAEVELLNIEPIDFKSPFKRFSVVTSKSSMSIYINAILYTNAFQNNEVKRVKIRISDHKTFRENDYDFDITSFNILDIFKILSEF